VPGTGDRFDYARASAFW